MTTAKLIILESALATLDDARSTLRVAGLNDYAEIFDDAFSRAIETYDRTMRNRFRSREDN
ncbi:hypothetical protein [Asticcacaulis sp. YBE204]|uniref:hypothetical protein n=1 Tax=Asticcacaulis sp. YBE204 TaxID=1282363 RepID=UPI0004CEF47E|nr:hypothetical protein [Asticcacaulis sp. YBE204]